MVFFFLSSTVSFEIPVLYQQIENRLCTTDRTPTALSIHKVKMNICFFCQRIQVPPPHSLPFLPPPPHLGSLWIWSSPPAVCVGEAVCLSGAMPVASEESSIRWGRGVRGGVLCCFSSFGRTTGCQSYYGSTVDTTGVSINTHARTAGSLRCL